MICYLKVKMLLWQKMECYDKSRVMQRPKKSRNNSAERAMGSAFASARMEGLKVTPEVERNANSLSAAG